MRKWIAFSFLFAVVAVGVRLYIFYINPASSALSKNLFQEPRIELSVRAESVLTGLQVPRSLAFTDSGRMLITERPGRIQQARFTDASGRVLVATPLAVLPQVHAEGEGGLMGLAVDPDYASNRFLYVSYTYETYTWVALRVSRFEDFGDHLWQEKVLLNLLPAAQFHNGSRIKFGPDGKLYVTVGDATEKSLAQDVKVFNGKILRIENDGSIPVDNPISGSVIRSWGHRNPQGIDRDSSGVMRESEHGPSYFDGAPWGDEINIVLPWKNYGRPEEHHENLLSGFIHPRIIFTPAVAPAALLVVKTKHYQQLDNWVLVWALAGEGIVGVQIDREWDRIVRSGFLSGIDLGRVREIVEWPDGIIYFTTSNRDGRGTPRTGDDQIMKLIVKDSSLFQ